MLSCGSPDTNTRGVRVLFTVQHVRISESFRYFFDLRMYTSTRFWCVCVVKVSSIPQSSLLKKPPIRRRSIYIHFPRQKKKRTSRITNCSLPRFTLQKTNSETITTGESFSPFLLLLLFCCSSFLSSVSSHFSPIGESGGEGRRKRHKKSGEERERAFPTSVFPFFFLFLVEGVTHHQQ